jgi:hypothetical protein
LKGKFKRENASETSSNCANKDGLTTNKHTNEKEDRWMELKVGRWTEIKCPFPLTGRNVGSANCFGTRKANQTKPNQTGNPT